MSGYWICVSYSTPSTCMPSIGHVYIEHKDCRVPCVYTCTCMLPVIHVYMCVVCNTCTCTCIKALLINGYACTADWHTWSPACLRYIWGSNRHTSLQTRYHQPCTHIHTHVYTCTWTLCLHVHTCDCTFIYVCRGYGLFIGVELVVSPDTKEPDGELAQNVIQRWTCEIFDPIAHYIQWSYMSVTFGRVRAQDCMKLHVCGTTWTVMSYGWACSVLYQYMTIHQMHIISVFCVGMVYTYPQCMYIQKLPIPSDVYPLISHM